jgi:CTP synthase
VQPDILACRTSQPIDDDMRRKIALFCNLEYEAVIEAMDASTIYEVPILMQKEKLDEVVLRKLKLEVGEQPQLEKWNDFLIRHKNPKNTVNIALVGKYVELKDSYISINESFIHAGAATETKVNVSWIHSEDLEDKTDKEMQEIFEGLDGVLVAPGFGERGIDGKINAIKYARVNNVPFLGICLGMQCAVIEFARNILNLPEAHSTEFSDTTKFPVIHLQADQLDVTEKGGTMRLGLYNCKIKQDSLASSVYSELNIYERHRHRYEFNNIYLNEFEAGGMIASGVNPEKSLVEIVEIPSHPWFIGVQFHPEYKSTVANPHPLFVSFINASLKNKTEHKIGKSKAEIKKV